MKKLIFTCCLLGLGATTLFAQQGNVAAGGNASGTGGTVSYSIGQVFYSSPSSANFSIVHGLQQPFEISVVGLDKNVTGINLLASVFPNPASDRFTLKVENGKWKTLSYQMYDMTGKLLSSGKVESEDTQIEVDHLATGSYLLKVVDGSEEIKTFKIVKVF